jgi:hypothetical protein
MPPGRRSVNGVATFEEIPSDINEGLARPLGVASLHSREDALALPEAYHAGVAVARLLLRQGRAGPQAEP